MKPKINVFSVAKDFHRERCEPPVTLSRAKQFGAICARAGMLHAGGMTRVSQNTLLVRGLCLEMRQSRRFE
jgi:hypothetical protein